MEAVAAPQDTRALIESASTATIRGRAGREVEATPHMVAVVQVGLAASDIEPAAVEVAARHRLSLEPLAPLHTRRPTRLLLRIRPGQGIGIIIVSAVTTTSIVQEGSCLNRFIKLLF